MSDIARLQRDLDKLEKQICCLRESIAEIVASDGNVVGPVSSTDNAIARFDGTTGELIQNSTAIITDAGWMGINGIPTFLSEYFANNNTGSVTDSTVCISNINNGAGSFAGFRVKIGTGEDGGSFIGSKNTLNTYGIGNGITLKTNVGTQDIGMSVGPNVLAGTGDGCQWYLKANGSVEHHYNSGNYCTQSVDGAGIVTLTSVGTGGGGSLARFSFQKPLFMTQLTLPDTTTAPVLGTATLIAGTVTVNTTIPYTGGTPFSGAKIFLSRRNSGGTPGTILTYTIVNYTSFTITSNNILDTSDIDWLIIVAATS